MAKDLQKAIVEYKKSQFVNTLKDEIARISYCTYYKNPCVKLLFIDGAFVEKELTDEEKANAIGILSNVLATEVSRFFGE